ncbi:hypothetical protein QBC35DRAFT_502435 [Podospora australis]|uniref:Uncharacterized protein n=1 Tax=Podospora australis TaxID=1536484 RepID=A0AAN7AHL0_9PEZI|nr:hypothetical protein QBC35DRAFT_502435 [Podospora australis]
MVRLTTILALATATAVSAQKDTYTTYPDKVPDATSYMKAIFTPEPIPSSVTPFITPLATGLYAVEKSFHENDKYISVHTVIASAMTHAPNPDAVYSSVSASGYRYEEIVTEEWYKKNVPKDAQKIVEEYNSAADAVWKSVEDAATRSTNHGAGPQCTGMAVAAAGVAAAGMAVMAAM